MKTHSNSNIISIGRGYGIEILNAVKNAKKEVKIVSPYLSSSYLDELVDLRQKGIEITLITSDNLTEPDTSYSFDDSKVIKQEKVESSGYEEKKKNLKKYSNGFFITSILIFLSSLFLHFFLYLAILLLIISGILFFNERVLKQYTYKYSSIFRLKVFDSHSGEKPWSTSLIHSKIFLIDNRICFLGSANFTYSGFKTHYETIIKVEDINSIQNINKEIEDLFESKELEAKDIQEWGREIYEN